MCQKDLNSLGGTHHPPLLAPQSGVTKKLELNILSIDQATANSSLGKCKIFKKNGVAEKNIEF